MVRGLPLAWRCASLRLLRAQEPYTPPAEAVQLVQLLHETPGLLRQGHPKSRLNSRGVKRE